MTDDPLEVPRVEVTEEQEREARALANLLMDAAFGLGMGSWRQTEKMLPFLLEALVQARAEGERAAEARVVQWLRRLNSHGVFAAEAIGRGDHLRRQP